MIMPGQIRRHGRAGPDHYCPHRRTCRTASGLHDRNFAGPLLTKVTAPVIGATQKHHVDGAVNAVALPLSPEDISYLEEAYQPHFLTGVMAQNTPQAKDHPQVWTR